MWIGRRLESTGGAGQVSFDGDQAPAGTGDAPSAHPTADLEMSMKILLPVDGSEYTNRMLAYIAAHDELLGKGHEYVVFTAVAPVPSHAARFLDRGTLDSYYKDAAEEVLRPIRRFVD